MKEIIANPIVVPPIKVEATNRQTVEYLIYFAFGFLEVMLAFRLLLKLTGANTISGFVKFIYGLTGIFVMPFQGIFHQAFSQGVDATAILEPATLVALIVYVLLAWGIVKLLRISSGEQQES